MIDEQSKMSWSSKIYDDKLSLNKITKQWQAEGDKVVFTNGVFDLIHKGHIAYLEEARQLGDRLIIGLNSDSSVSRLKGEYRPINEEAGRLAVIAGLQCVDAVVVFDEDTPLELITTLIPDVLVKGGDYELSDIVGGKEVLENGGEVKKLQFLEGYSSTKIIDKILRNG